MSPIFTDNKALIKYFYSTGKHKTLSHTTAKITFGDFLGIYHGFMVGSRTFSPFKP